jgi:rod shape-determining protein MreD
MIIVRNILFIALALLLQSTVLGRFSILGVRPDIAMLALMVLVNSSGSAGSIVYGFCIGFIQDVYSPEFLGANAFTMSLMGCILDYIKESLTIENISVKACVMFTACIVHDIVYVSFYTRFDFAMMKQLLIMESILSAVYTSSLLVLILLCWEWIIGGGFSYVVHGLFGHR